MGLVDKFKGNIGDLVLFSKENSDDGRVGWVRGYTDKKVYLSNKPTIQGGRKRDCSWGNRLPGEKGYTADLGVWDTYKILRKYKQDEGTVKLPSRDICEDTSLGAALLDGIDNDGDSSGLLGLIDQSTTEKGADNKEDRGLDGISVFDEDDLEIAADPMAKTLLTGADEYLTETSLNGEYLHTEGGSGLLDLTSPDSDNKKPDVKLL